MNYTKKFLYSLMENNYLDFHGLHLTNDEFDKCLKVYEPRFERTFIKHIELSGNKLNRYNCSDILKIFPYLQYIHSPDINSVDITSSPQLSIVD